MAPALDAERDRPWPIGRHRDARRSQPRQQQDESTLTLPRDLPPILERFQERFAFPLDRFQLDAMEALHDGFSVLVTAPTGSGKTLVAEFAIYDALDRGLKTIYTTPLKALSNQKFRDLQQDYGEDQVGLVTGDLSINPAAPIVVMTTEILRNILYQEPGRLDPVLYVVLDEVHYMNDRDRGTVWEETIIHAPAHLHLVALSATVANAPDVAAWISSIRGEVKVIEHFDRPVPLKHYYFTDETLFPLFGPHKGLNSDLKRRASTEGWNRPRRRADTDIVKVVEALAADDLLPAIYFIFSRRGCDNALTECLMAELDLVSRSQREAIRKVVDRVVRENPSLKQTGPVTNRVLKALPRGLAVHHAGLVPVLRHLVEELFQAGLIKVVFATETLAAGINMPARTTVISSMSKRADFGHRLLTVSEFTQMTGRAGRRGKDVVGHAVVVDDGFQTVRDAVALATGTPDPIESQFTLSYNMVLNLMRNFPWEAIRDLLKRSFGQYQSNREIVNLRRTLEEQQRTQAAGATLCELKPELSPGEIPLLDYESRIRRLDRRVAALKAWKIDYEGRQDDRLEQALDEANVGSLVLVRVGRNKPAKVGVLVQRKRATNSRHYQVLVYINGGLFKVTRREISHVSKRSLRLNLPEKAIAKGRQLKLYGWYKNLPSLIDEQTTAMVLEEAKDRAYEAHVRSEEKAIAHERQELATHFCAVCPVLPEHQAAHDTVRHVTAQIEALQRQIEEQQELYLGEFLRFIKVLEHFGHLKDGKPTEIGELNAHIRSTNGLFITELLRRGILDGLEPAEVAAVVSTVVFEPRRNMTVTMDGVPKTTRMAIEQVYQLASQVQHVQGVHGIQVPVNVELAMVPVVIAWGRGAEWSKVAKATQMDDGDLVRAMRQLIDLLHQLRQAPGVPVALQATLNEAIAALDRDLISATI